MILKVPVRPHVKKFLLARFPQPYVLSDDNYIGIILYRLLRRQEHDACYDRQLTKYTESFNVDVSEDKAFNHGSFYISSYSVVVFNNFIDDLFKEKMYAFLDDLFLFADEITIKKGIYEYMNKYNMLEGTDVTYDGLKKAYYRYRKEREEQPKSA